MPKKRKFSGIWSQDIPIGFVKRAWKEARAGRNQIIGRDKEQGIRIHRVVKFKDKNNEDKMLLMAYERPHYLEILTFPKPEHFTDFNRSARGVKYGGPAEENSAAIGYVGISKSGKNYVLRTAQAQFKIGEGKKRLPAEIAKPYLGWRKRAIKEAIEIVKERGSALRIKADAVERGEFLNDLDFVCAELGFTREFDKGRIYGSVRYYNREKIIVSADGFRLSKLDKNMKWKAKPRMPEKKLRFREEMSRFVANRRELKNTL